MDSEIYWVTWQKTYCSQLMNPSLRYRGFFVSKKTNHPQKILSSHRWKISLYHHKEFGNYSSLLHSNLIFTFLSLLTWTRFSPKYKLLRKNNNKQQHLKSSQRKWICYRHGSRDTNDCWLFSINNRGQETMGKYL